MKKTSKSIFLAVFLASTSYPVLANNLAGKMNVSEAETREVEQRKLGLIQHQKYVSRQLELDADRKRLQMELELIRVDSELATDNTVDPFFDQPPLKSLSQSNSTSTNTEQGEEAKILARYPHWGRTIHTYEFNEWLLEQVPEVKRLSESKRAEDVIILLDKFEKEKRFLD